MLRTKEQWEKIYEGENTPWNAGVAEPYLVNLVGGGKVKPGKAIDFGCGTGNESIFLATRGFKVTGVDISENAITLARRNAEQINVDCTFIVASVLEIPINQKYDFVLDRACFHFLDPSERQQYIDEVRSLLKPSGMFLLFVSSDQETPKNTYQFSREEIYSLFSNQFDILNIDLVTLETHKEKPKPYVCLMKRK